MGKPRDNRTLSATLANHLQPLKPPKTAGTRANEGAGILDTDTLPFTHTENKENTSAITAGPCGGESGTDPKGYIQLRLTGPPVSRRAVPNTQPKGKVYRDTGITG